MLQFFADNGFLYFQQLKAGYVGANKYHLNKQVFFEAEVGDMNVDIIFSSSVIEDNVKDYFTLNFI